MAQNLLKGDQIKSQPNSGKFTNIIQALPVKNTEFHTSLNILKNIKSEIEKLGHSMISIAVQERSSSPLSLFLSISAIEKNKAIYQRSICCTRCNPQQTYLRALSANSMAQGLHKVFAIVLLLCQVRGKPFDQSVPTAEKSLPDLKYTVCEDNYPLLQRMC